MDRLKGRFAALITITFALAQISVAQTTTTDPATAALLKRVQDLERTLAEVKGEIAVQSQAAAAAALTAASQASAPADAAAAAPEPADDSHTLGFLQLRGYSDMGFGRAVLENQPVGGLQGSTHSFTIGDFDLFASSHLNSHLTFLGEALITSDFSNDFSAEMDRLMLTYNFNKYLSVTSGKFNTAIGYYSNAFHRARYFQTATGRPLLFADEDAGGILPVHSVGLSATGAIPSGTVNFHWVAEVANGRAAHSPDTAKVQNFVDENNGKAVNFALYARPEALPGFEAGVSVYRDKLHPEGISALDQKIYSGHVVLVRPHLELLAEGVLLQHEFAQSKETFNTYAGYGQASYQMRQFRPYFRYDYQNVPASDPIFGSLSRQNGPAVGVKYDFSDFGAFKVQYGRLGLRSGDTTNVFQAQIAFAF